MPSVARQDVPVNVGQEQPKSPAQVDLELSQASLPDIGEREYLATSQNAQILANDASKALISDFINNITENGNEYPYGEFKVEEFARLHDAELRAYNQGKNPAFAKIWNDGEKLLEQVKQNKRESEAELERALVELGLNPDELIDIEALPTERPSHIDGTLQIALRVMTADTRAVYTFERGLNQEREWTMKPSAEAEISELGSVAGMAHDPLFRSRVENALSHVVHDHIELFTNALSGKENLGSQAKEFLTKSLQNADPILKANLVTSTIREGSIFLGLSQPGSDSLNLLELGVRPKEPVGRALELTRIRDLSDADSTKSSSETPVLWQR